MGHSSSRFLLIGVVATCLYTVVALCLSASGLSVALASLAAYLIAAPFSYVGHKYFTFGSDRAHRFEAPRFIAVTVVGITVSLVMPAIMSGRLGLPVQVSIVLTSLLIPIANYLVLRGWVFHAGAESSTK